MDNTLRLGQAAEGLVATYLEAQGFEILDRNVRVGRLELDLIARKRSLLVICEVRSRYGQSRQFGAAARTIGPQKKRHLRAAATIWLRQARHTRPSVAHLEVRLDAASVDFENGEPRITYYEGAW